MVSESDAIDDPDNRGFWTTLALWNRWRHDTYKDNREAESEYLDELPKVPEAAAETDAKKAAAPAEVKQYFSWQSEGMHTVGGQGKMKGQQHKVVWWACKKEGCRRGTQKPIKQIGSGTGDLFSHLDTCQPELAKQLRISSTHSPVRVGEDGEEYTIFSFDELLPHHIRFVMKCFQNLDHFYETRAGNGLLEWVQGYEKRAALPHEQTCQQILEERRA